MSRTFSVRPQDVQLDPAQQTDPFPWYTGCQLHITATGMIGSGVVCTGLTPPGGWSEQRVTGHADWPFHGINAHPYCLIGSIDGGPWFFVGTDYFELSIAGPATDVSRLRLAVNRPHLDQTAAGDNEWTVQVDTMEPSDDPMACRTALNQLSELRGAGATAACNAVQSAKSAVSDRVTQMTIMFSIFGGLTVALTSVATAVFVVDATTRAAAQQAQATALQTLVTDALPHVAHTTLATLLGGPVAGLAATATVGGLAAIASAAASPLMANPFVAAVIVGLIIAAIAAAAITLVMLLSLLTLGAEVDNAVSDWQALVSGVQSLMTLIRGVCPAPYDETVPSCAAVGT